MRRHDIQNGFTAPPPTYECIRTQVFRKIMSSEFFRQLVIIQQRCCLYDDVYIISYTGWRCGRIGKEQAGGAASQKNHFIDQRAKFLNSRFKDFDIGVVTNITHEHLDYHKMPVERRFRGGRLGRYRAPLALATHVRHP